MSDLEWLADELARAGLPFRLIARGRFGWMVRVGREWWEFNAELVAQRDLLALRHSLDFFKRSGAW